jgi:HAD superfamily hydrolase (TIGR01509 family)
MPEPPRLLLFDLDHVLVDYDHAARCAALARALGEEARADDIRIALFGPDGLEFGCDRGEYGLDEYLDRAHARHGWRWRRQDFVAARREATRVDAGMLALCRALAPQARLAVFTNNGAWIGEHAADIAPGLAEVFGADFVSSGELRASKPGPAAFRACCERLGVAPCEAFFTDDKAVNVDGARQAGLDAHHFTGLTGLREALLARGFDLPGDFDAP